MTIRSWMTASALVLTTFFASTFAFAHLTMTNQGIPKRPRPMKMELKRSKPGSESAMRAAHETLMAQRKRVLAGLSQKKSEN